jgi:hypothetical protein
MYVEFSRCLRLAREKDLPETVQAECHMSSAGQ